MMKYVALKKGIFYTRIMNAINHPKIELFVCAKNHQKTNANPSPISQLTAEVAAIFAPILA